MIAIVDYKAGNLHNLKNALDAVGAKAEIVENPEKLNDAEKIILPGVGSFGFCRENLKRSGFEKTVKEMIGRGAKVLGICVGMQLFFDEGEENPESPGLGLIPGTVRKFPGTLKIPQIGWNSIHFKPDPVFEGIENDSWFYFVHSYFCSPDSPDHVLGESEYSLRFSSVVRRENLYGFQFHPEKSHEAGLRLLNNFCSLPC